MGRNRKNCWYKLENNAYNNENRVLVMKLFFHCGGAEIMKMIEDKTRAGLVNEISELESALLNFYNSMQLVSEDGLLDFYAYLIKAYEAKHQYLLKKLKEI